MFGTQQRALRIGLAAAAMVGLAVIPTAAMAATSGGAAGHLGSEVIAQVGPRVPRASHLATLATALGVTPDVLQAAMQTARESVGKPDRGALRDETARAEYHAQYIAALAAALNLDVATVQAALDANKPEGPKPQRDGQRRGHPGVHDFGAKHLDGVAESLGVTVDALRAAFQAARESVEKPDPASMRDEAARAAFELQVLTAVAANLGVDVAQLQAALEAARPDPAALKAQARTHLEERLAAQVASGKMTQERADEMLARFDAGTFSKFRGAERGDRGEQVRPAGRGGPGQRA